MTIVDAILQLVPTAIYPQDFRVKDGAIIEWSHAEPQPTAERIAAIIASAVQAEATSKSEATTLRTGILAQANAAVGIAYGNVTAGMVKALVWALLWKVGALNKDLTVRPLGEWMRE